MPYTTNSTQSSTTSGTSTNTTFGDKLTKRYTPLYEAAAGLNMSAARQALKQQYGSKQAAAAAGYGGKEGVSKYALEQMTPMNFYPEPTYVPMDPRTDLAQSYRTNLATRDVNASMTTPPATQAAQQALAGVQSLLGGGGSGAPVFASTISTPGAAPPASAVAAQNTIPQYAASAAYEAERAKQWEPAIRDIMNRAVAMAGGGTGAADQGLATAQQAAQVAQGGLPVLGDARTATMGALGMTQAAQPYLQDVIGGKYLDKNPYLDQVYNRAADALKENYLTSVLPALEGRFAHAGGMGGAQQAMYQNAMGEMADALGGMGTDIYYQNYNAERGRQQEASQLMADLARATTGAGEGLTGIGLSQADISRAMSDAGRGATDVANARAGLANALTGAGRLPAEGGQLGLQGGALKLGAGDLLGTAGQLGISTAQLQPSLQQMAYYGADELERAGRTYEQQASSQLQDLMNRFYFGQDAGFNELNRLVGGVTQLPLAAGGGTTDWTQRTVGQGSQSIPSPADNSIPLWATLLKAGLDPGGIVKV